MRGFGGIRWGGWFRNCFIMRLVGSFELKKMMWEKLHALEYRGRSLHGVLTYKESREMYTCTVQIETDI